MTIFVGGLNVAILANLGQLTRDLFCAINERGLTRLKNRSKLVQGSLYAIIVLLIERKVYHFVVYMTRGGMFSQQSQKFFIK